MELINEQEFNERIKGEKPVVCDFFAKWCAPCRMLAPVLEDVGEKFSGKADFVKVDIDENFSLAQKYSVMSIPLVAVFENGEMKAKSLGYMNKEEAEKFLNENL